MRALTGFVSEGLDNGRLDGGGETALEAEMSFGVPCSMRASLRTVGNVDSEERVIDSNR